MFSQIETYQPNFPPTSCQRAMKPLQPSGLMANLTTLPQQLQSLGYNTHIVGKWHLGKIYNI